MLDGDMLLRQKRDEVPVGTLSCPDRNMEVFNQLSHYEGLRLLPSVCGWKLIQQTIIIRNERMKALTKVLSLLDKISITAFICSLSYQGYTNGKNVLSLITLFSAFAFFVYLCRYYRNKPFGNKIIDIFVITMCIIDFANSEDIPLIGGTAIIAALIDLFFFLYLDYCEIKRVCK